MPGGLIPFRPRAERAQRSPLAVWQADFLCLGDLRSCDVPKVEQAKMHVIVNPDDRFWIQVCWEEESCNTILAGDRRSNPSEVLRELMRVFFRLSAPLPFLPLMFPLL